MDNQNEENRKIADSLNHELKIHLSGILSKIEILKYSEKDEGKMAILDSIITCSEKLLGNINRIRDGSITDDSKYVEKEELFNLEESVKKVFETYVNFVKREGVEFIFTNNLSNENMVMGFRNKVELILLNAISNSNKFTSKGFIEICINKIIEKEEKTFVEILIKDSGKGIEETMLKVINEEFKKGEYYIIKKISTLGLGLSFLKEMIDELNGEIEIESELNKGTCVFIRIPFEIL